MTRSTICCTLSLLLSLLAFGLAGKGVYEHAQRPYSPGVGVAR